MPKESSGDVPIEALLREMGFASLEARRAARAELERTGVTNPRKTNISVAKLDRVREVLAKRFIRTCDDCAPATPGRRIAVAVGAQDCEVCAGSVTNRSLRALEEVAAHHGIERIVIVGGSPQARATLRNGLANSSLRVDLLDGTITTGKRGATLAANADIIVIWGGTILSHKVTAGIALPRYAAKTVTVTRRSIEALVQAVELHLAQRK